MKQLISFRMSFIILATVAALVSCSKEKKPDPIVIVPPPPQAPSLSIGVTGAVMSELVGADSTYYIRNKGSLKFNIVSDGQVTVNSSYNFTNPFELSNQTKDTVLKFVSIKTVSDVSSLPTTKQIAIAVSTPREDSISIPRWRLDSLFTSNDLSSPTEIPIGYDGFKNTDDAVYQFLINKDLVTTVYSGINAGTYVNKKGWKLLNNETQIWLGQFDTRDIESITSTTMYFTQVIQAGNTPVWTKVKYKNKKVD